MMTIVFSDDVLSGPSSFVLTRGRCYPDSLRWAKNISMCFGRFVCAIHRAVSEEMISKKVRQPHLFSAELGCRGALSFGE